MYISFHTIQFLNFQPIDNDKDFQDDADVDEDFQFLQPLDLITKDVHELQKIIKAKKENLQRDKPMEKERDAAENEQGHQRELSKDRQKEKQQREKEQDKERMDKDKESEKSKDKEKVLEDCTDAKMVGDKTGPRHDENGMGEGNLHVSVLLTRHTLNKPHL